MVVSPSRLLALQKLQTTLFSQTFNPHRLRTGNKVLRQRLKGPAIASYYPPRTATIKDLKRVYRQLDGGVLDLDTWDEDEEERLEHVALAKLRGKGAPKKKRAPVVPESKAVKGKKGAVGAAPVGKKRR